MTYLFTKEGCCKCEWVKNKLGPEKMSAVQVMPLDGENPESLAMLAYFECVSLSEKSLPILVSEEGKVITGAIPIRDYIAGH